jgi:hypothetical protein
MHRPYPRPEGVASWACARMRSEPRVDAPVGDRLGSGCGRFGVPRMTARLHRQSLEGSP